MLDGNFYILLDCFGCVECDECGAQWTQNRIEILENMKTIMIFVAGKKCDAWVAPTFDHINHHYVNFCRFGSNVLAILNAFFLSFPLQCVMRMGGRLRVPWLAECERNSSNCWLFLSKADQFLIFTMRATDAPFFCAIFSSIVRIDQILCFMAIVGKKSKSNEIAAAMVFHWFRFFNHAQSHGCIQMSRNIIFSSLLLPHFQFSIFILIPAWFIHIVFVSCRLRLYRSYFILHRTSYIV